MVYNEPVFLPMWLRHYGAHLGIENCFVIDHGSDDGSTDGTGASVIKLPRSPMDNVLRVNVNHDLVSMLLRSYDVVYRVDVDEFLVPDPAVASTLLEFAECEQRPVIRSIGYDLIDCNEPPIDLARPISFQRNWLSFSGYMCKTVMVREPVTWVGGFHDSDPSPVLGRLFLFHLRFFDIQHGFTRMAKTRSMPWTIPTAGKHQKWSDDQLIAFHKNYGRSDTALTSTLREDDPNIAALLAEMFDGEQNLNVRSPELFVIPDDLR
ncbi:MAG: glycosyltransferase family 2 protein, partial [Planktomarina sp.]